MTKSHFIIRPGLILLLCLLQACGTSGAESDDSPANDSGNNTGGGIAAVCGSSPPSAPIADYVESSPRTNLGFVPDDLSGITYNYDSDTLYMIRNNLTTIWETTTSYQLIRTINTTANFGDSEGIVYLGNDEYAIVSEESVLYIGRIPPGSTDIIIDPDDFQKITFAPDGGNLGPEGVTFDVTTQRFYISKERNERKLYSFIRPASNADMTVVATEPFNAQTTPNPRLTQDMSGVFFDPASGRLLVLSKIDYRVMDIALDGTVFGNTLDFPSYAQYEGITLDCNRNLHVVGEPNFYHVYSPN